MSGVWGPERRLLAAGGNTGASGGTSEPRTDYLGNEIVAQDGIVQDEATYWRARVKALEGALVLLLGELYRARSE